MTKPNEYVALIQDEGIYRKGARWRVTARYVLQLSERRTVQCVRLSAEGRTWHLSEDELERLFKKTRMGGGKA